jgi:hypothetical protein
MSSPNETPVASRAENPTPQKERFAAFGKELFDKYCEQIRDSGGSEATEEAMELAEKYDLVRKVIYDSQQHGEGLEAEPGEDWIWWWGHLKAPSVSDGGTSPASGVSSEPNLIGAAQEALLALAAWKLTDEQEQYREVGPGLRKQFNKAHDLLFAALPRSAS